MRGARAWLGKQLLEARKQLLDAQELLAQDRARMESQSALTAAHNKDVPTSSSPSPAPQSGSSASANKPKKKRQSSAKAQSTFQAGNSSIGESPPNKKPKPP